MVIAENNDIRKGGLMLMLGAVIWGCTFVVQNVGMEHVGPFTFNCVRSFIATITLLPFVLVRASRERQTNPERTAQEQRMSKRVLLAACFLMFFAVILAQLPTKHSERAKAAQQGENQTANTCRFN